MSNSEDAWGASHGKTEPETLEAWASTVESVIGHRADAPALLDQVLALDPSFPMAFCLQGYGSLFKGRRDLRPRALEAADRADEAIEERGGSERERHLAAALRSWAQDDPNGALRRFDLVLEAHPVDPWVIKLQHGLLFILGRQKEMLAALERVMPAWSEDTRAYGYMLGCHAFALEETMNFDAAEPAARKAVALQPDDAWGIHALAHVLEMHDRSQEGIDWLIQNRDGYEACAVFRGHVYWHRALFHMALEDYDQALALYDEEITRPWAGDYREMSNRTSLLYQLEEASIDVGERWQMLGEIASTHATDHGSAFADAHYAFALARTGGADTLKRSLTTHIAEQEQTAQAIVVREVGAPLCQAIVDSLSDRPAKALDLLCAHQEQVVRIGGSNAQRDLFEVLLIDTAIRAGRTDVVRQQLDRRLSLRPANRWGKSRLAAL